MFNKIRVILSLGFIFTLFGLHAQTDQDAQDPAGFVTKYNQSFAGIGPKVYVLPAPRTKQEEITDSYQEKKGFYDSISRKLDFRHYRDDFKFTHNSGYIRSNFKPLPNSEKEWNELITKLEKNNNAALASALANEYAWELLQDKQTDKTIAVLGRGINAISHLNSPAERTILQQNLASAYLYTGNFAQAADLQERFLKEAVSDNVKLDQANILVKIALINAYVKNYDAAENTIIRRAIPLFNKTKNYPGKVNALVKLAKIYQLGNKHIQAQWFLIQARDLSREKKIQTHLPDIEYMLAYSKYIQQNYQVAQAEFKNAKILASDDDNKILQLAIHDKLGEIYLLMGNFEDAEKELTQYWQLRNELF